MKAIPPEPIHPDRTLAARLLRHVERQPNGCLIWTGSLNDKGYGRITNGHQSVRRMVQVHRAAFTLFVRPLERGEHVLHRCDNPPCIEPTHLFAGDHPTNMHDMAVKGRAGHGDPQQRGSRNSQTHLTEDDVRDMRRSRERGDLLREIAERFDISIPTASEICSHRTWTHVA